jgi:hypothetical protein
VIDRERIKEILEDSLSEARRTDFVPAQDEELSELCRVYLAWLDAPEAWMSYNIEEYMCAHGNDAAEQERIDAADGKRVRLVEVK